MAYGKLPYIRWGAFDNFEEYGSDATLATHWVESGAGINLATPAVGTDQKWDQQKALKLALSHTFGGGALDYLITRTFTGLAPSTQYSIECRLRRTAAIGTPVLWSNGEINSATPADNAWGLSGVLTATSTAAGELPVRLEVRSILDTQSVTYWFDEVRVYRTITLGWPFDTPTSWSRPKPGYRRARTLYVEDVWDEGHDQLLRFGARWIPPVTIANPTATGWNAAGGWREFLEFANGGRVFQVVPDRDVPSTYHNVRLVEPITEAPAIEPDGTRSVTLLVRTIDDTSVTSF